MKLTAESTVINDDKLNTNIDNAQNTANSAKQIADDTAQYFWFTSSGSDTGAHISEKTQAEFIANPSGGNLLARSNGIAVRDGLTELATFGASGIEQTIATSIAVGQTIAFGGSLNVPALSQAVSGTVITLDTYGEDDITGSIYALELTFTKGTATTIYAFHYDGDSTFSNGNSETDFTINRIKFYVSTTPPNIKLGTTATDGALSIGQLVGGASRDVFDVDWNGNVSATGDISTMGNLDILGDINTHGGDIYTDDLYLKNAKMDDFVTEQGTYDIWTYRKWKSGVMECWGTYTDSIAITTSAAAYGGYRSGAINIPAFPLTFASAPSVTATANSATGFWVNNVVPTTTGGTFYLSAGASLAAANRSIAFHVIGS